MAISHFSEAESPDAQTPLVQGTVVDGVVDYKGNPALRANSGCWRSASFLIGVEVAERFAYFGISCNLITYLTDSLGQSTATAAENVNAWSGMAQLLPLSAATAPFFLPLSSTSWFLNKALLTFPDNSQEGSKIYTVSDVEEAKAVLRLFPIWSTSLVYAIVYAQCTTFFTKQGATMDGTIFPGFDIPAASLQSLIGLAIVLIIPIYDRLFVPLARAFTKKPSGITMLQRIGTGMLLSAICMVVAALVEIKRLKTAQEYGLVDMPEVILPMSYFGWFLNMFSPWLVNKSSPTIRSQLN